MEAWVFIVGMLIFALSIIGGAFIISGAIAGSTKSGTGASAMRQPSLTFFTEYDASDYLGISLKELDYMRESGMLDGTFMAVTSLEQTGEEEYYDVVDGVEIVKIRPVMSNITRYLFNKDLLDAKMLEIIKEGRALDTSERLSRSKDRANRRDRKDNRDRREGGEKKNREDRPSRENREDRPSRENREDRPNRENREKKENREDRPNRENREKLEKRDNADSSEENTIIIFDDEQKPAKDRDRQSKKPVLEVKFDEDETSRPSAIADRLAAIAGEDED